MHTHVHTQAYTQVYVIVHSSRDHGTPSLRPVGWASSLETQAGIDAAILRQNLFFIYRHVKLENRLSAPNLPKH